jgi:pSer/pThr/pTyr-binding forkhead associated (FHA) protein
MSASWRLRVERGPNAGQSFPIDRPSATIGRQENNAIVLDDARLSRQHARVESGPLGLTVTDLNSANGTLVNGRPVTGSVPLHAGDRLQLGDTVMVLEGGAPASLGGASAPLGDADATMIASAPVGGLASASTPAADVPRLVVQETGKVFHLDRPSMVIGRQPENELPLEDTQSSRQHARFEIRDGQVTVSDLNSANGTRVNGVRISVPTMLNNGDVVQIGTSHLRVDGITFVDHGTAVALGFFPPPPTGPSLDAAPSLGDAPPLGAAPAGGSPFDGPLIEGATVIGGPPPMASAPPLAGGPPLGGPALGGPSPLGGPVPLSTPPVIGGPPPGAPGQPWNAPQFGGSPPLIQPPMPPSAPARRRSGPPLLLIGVGALLLLLCIGAGIGAFALSRRDNNDPTATPAGGVGTPLPVAAATPSSSGSSGGNTAPPPPGASPAPSVAPTTGAQPSAAPSTAAFQPTPTAPRASARPSAPASGGRQTVEVAEVGLVYSLPADWEQTRDEDGRAQFVSPDGRASILVRWSDRAASGVTARSLIEDELEATASGDRNFDPASVETGVVQVGGRQGYGSATYTFTGNNGTRYSEADRAVVIPNQAQYFFAFLALESAFDGYTAVFNEIIGTIEITGP